VSWDWYSDNFFGSTLNLTDGRYRSRSVYHLEDFFQQAADGTLPSVCWIDPLFINSPGVIAATDDHPPADVRHGQDFVLNIYHALVSNPVQWNKTLFVLVYDEHGGFYDHIGPPAAQDDRPNFRSYGVRVPAILVSPWVPQGKAVSNLSITRQIIKTILLRFCRAADGSIPDMGKRVMAANHLGYALTEATPRPSPLKGELRPRRRRLGGLACRTFERDFNPIMSEPISHVSSMIFKKVSCELQSDCRPDAKNSS
jgi:phospholipase C